ncbi:hypothetical protein B0H16DRAFT_1363088 [Mycena metata]|uniref:F-box domain-containing protein n=1 Tax=Mycena metata TaxID=1033252 RepID=A0AAD7JW66_9AGAR|nr:hypothetical protein B0H16DRAFT_1363088 [Mycena metata]
MLSAPPSSRVLAIPELLDMIFAYLDDPSNASNASVCKQWSNVALDTLWRDLNDLHRLFSILKPLKQVGEAPDSPYAFVQAPDAEDWRRLEKYSRRVRRFRFLQVDSDSEGPRLCPTVFEDVARTRTSLNLLPNLTSLAWHGPLSFAPLFLHNNIKHFVLYLPIFIPPESPLPFFRDVASRMPSLSLLDLRTRLPMRDMEEAALFLLRSLPKLRKVIFPRYSATTRIIETLATLEDLGCVEFQYVAEQGIGDPADTAVFKPTLNVGAFPSLWDLSLTCRVEDCIAFMKQTFAPVNLTALYVDSQLIESPAAVHELLLVLADTCQLLEALGIITLIGGVTEEGPQTLAEVPSADRINFATLRPLQNFPNLNIFEIIHQYPLDLQLEELEQLARSWPSLRKLILNNEPVISDESSLTLKALLPFARHCPELEQLGLFINASTADLPSTYHADLPPAYQSKPFSKLRRLSMGVSLIADEGSIALFLSQICPLNTDVECGITWETPEQREEQALLAVIQERCVKWAKVLELLPLLTKLRMEERERTRLLMAEVEDLRMRSGVLMDRVKAAGGDSCVML